MAIITIIMVNNVTNIALSQSISSFHYIKPSDSALVFKSNGHFLHHFFVNSFASISPLLASKFSTSNTTDKVVILTFGDTYKSQATNAMPILNKYGYKGNFFVTCLWVGSHIYGMPRLTWQDVSALQKDGQNIDSKTMTHRAMTHLSPTALNYEVAASKKCLADHDINTTTFATTHGNERDNATIIKEIAKYYDFAVNGFSSLMFLHCNGYSRYSSQTDCRTYFDNGSLTFVNRYSIREWSHNNRDKALSHNDSKIFDAFVNEVNSQEKYNRPNAILAVPIVAYHSIDNNKTSDSTDIDLFAQEMQYLYDNHFRVLTLNDLGYDTKNNVFYIKPHSTTR